MYYDPIKKKLGVFFNYIPFFRILFYRLLDILLLRTWHIKRKLKKFKRNHTTQINVLDAGSGFGQYVYFLSKLNPQWNIVGIDIKQEQIEACNAFFKKIKRNNVIFQLADLTQYVKPNYFSLILSVDVMEHIVNDHVVFKNFYASLKDNGLLLISTPSDIGGSDANEHTQQSFIEEHARNGYNFFEIKQKLLSLGFKKVEVKYTYGFPGNLSWLISIKYPISLININKIFIVLLPIYYLILFFPITLLNFFDVWFSHKKGTGLLIKAWK